MGNDPTLRKSPAAIALPLSEEIVSRIQASLEASDVAETGDCMKDALRELGYAIRQWRLERKLSRHFVAGRVGMEVGQLLILEHGLACEQDIHETELRALASLLFDSAQF